MGTQSRSQEWNIATLCDDIIRIGFNRMNTGDSARAFFLEGLDMDHNKTGIYIKLDEVNNTISFRIGASNQWKTLG